MDRKMSEKLPPLGYYKWHWQAWRANRKVQRMTYIERGLYRELLDECWSEGFIPNNIEELSEICGCPSDVMANAWQVLSSCFVAHGEVLINERIEQERTEKDSIRANRARAGKAGGLAKSLKEIEIEANAKQVLASASKCHIEEKRREEKSIEIHQEILIEEKVCGELLLKSGDMFPIYESQIDKWESIYSSIDVVYQLKLMKAWLESNPAKRKTKTGMMKFINGWLKRANEGV